MLVHLVGAQESNAPWGFENRLLAAMGRLGWEVISTDFRKEREQLAERLELAADLVLVCKGEGIEPALIRRSKATTVLWYAEQVGTKDATDDLANARRAELARHGPAFDYVFSHDAGNLDVYRQLGCSRVGCLPTAAVDPAIHVRIETPKQHDVVFVGQRTDRRARFIESLSQRFAIHWPAVWDPIELNRLFNQSRIVLNLHLSDLPNTETRLCEAAGAGAFVLTETPSTPAILVDGEHAVYFAAGDVDDCAAKIEHYLSREDERERIAAAGYKHVHEHHTVDSRLRTIAEIVDLRLKRRRWPGTHLGVLRDKWGLPTSSMGDFAAAFERQLTLAGFAPTPCAMIETSTGFRAWRTESSIGIAPETGGGPDAAPSALAANG